MRHVLNTSFLGCSWRDLLLGLYSIYFIFMYETFGAASTADSSIFVPLSCDADCVHYYYYCYYYYYYFSCHRPILPGNSLEPTVIPTVQASGFTHCSTFRIMCDVPSIAVFCSESIECFLVQLPNFSLSFSLLFHWLQLLLV